MKISVVIPLYNKRDTILRAVISVFSQTVQPEEIIVVNDGSTDGSELIVADLAHELLRLISQTNQGVSAARNSGIREANGKWVAFLDADDEWLPDFLKTITKLIENYPECSVAATAYFLQDPAGCREKNHLRKLRFKGDLGVMDNYFQVASCSHPPIHSSAIAVKKEAIQSVGGFPLDVSSGEDLLTWARLASKFQIAYSIRPLSIFNQDPAHIYNERPNRTPQKPDIVGEGLISIAREHKALPQIRKYTSLWFKMRSSIYLRLGLRKSSFRQALRSVFFNPLNYKVYVYFLLMPLPTGLVNGIFSKVRNG